MGDEPNRLTKVAAGAKEAGRLQDAMGQWLARDLFDEVPDGIPPLDPEKDDEYDEDDHDDGDNGMEPETYAGVTQTLAPEGFETDTSVGFFLLPEESQMLPGPEAEKHCTSVYLGHIDGDGAPNLKSKQAWLQQIANSTAKRHDPFTAEVTGVEPLGDEGAMVWMLDSQEAHAIFDEIKHAVATTTTLLEEGTFTQYPEYLPHVTIGYATDDAGTTLSSEDLEEAAHVDAITFDRLALWWGDQHIEFPLGNLTAQMDEYAREHDESKVKRGEPGSGKGGQFLPKDGGASTNPAKDAAEKDRGFQSEAAQRRAMVKSILDAMKDIFSQLTSAQARALIDRIEKNAKAFLDAQDRSTPGGGGGSKGKDSGGAAEAGGKASKDGAGEGAAGGGGKGGGSDTNGPLEGLIASVSGLLKMFGHNMNDDDRAKLERSINDLKELG